jgi:hypothetical protein
MAPHQTKTEKYHHKFSQPTLPIRMDLSCWIQIRIPNNDPDPGTQITLLF